MSQTQTTRFADPAMLRKLVAKTHRDAGGDDELFIFANALRESLLSGELLQPRENAAPRCSNCVRRHDGPRRSRQTAADDSDRIPFAAGLSFDGLTSVALQRSRQVENVHGRLLLLLEDCFSLYHLAHEECRGASYKRLAYIAHLASMSKSQRIGWYRVAEEIPLSDRHAGHLITRLKRRTA